MIELPLDHSDRIEPLFASCVADRAWLFPNLHRRTGRLFVNDAASPTAVLYQAAGKILFLGGEPDDFSAKELTTKLAELRPPANAFLIPASQDWISRYLTDTDFTFCGVQRLSFLSGPDTSAVRRWEEAVPPGYCVRQMDALLAARVARELDPDFAHHWPDPVCFAKTGAGYCVSYGETMVSCAWSAWKPAKQILLTVRTAPDHRGRGLACVAAAGLIRWAMARSIQVDWNTGSANFSSQKCARKLGYETEMRHEWMQYTPYHAGKRAATVPPEAFDRLVGEYVHEGSGTCFSFSRLQDRLMFEEHRVPLHQMVPLGNGRFFLRNENVEMEFSEGVKPELTVYKNRQVFHLGRSTVWRHKNESNP